MAENQSTEQEARNAHVGIRVTRFEKRAVQLVAAYKDINESELLREMLLSDIVAEHARLFPAQVAERASA